MEFLTAWAFVHPTPALFKGQPSMSVAVADPLNDLGWVPQEYKGIAALKELVGVKVYARHT